MSIVRFPGLVDVHVHLREPGGEQKEDFESGTKAALAGGYVAVFDMPNNPEPIVTPDALENKFNLAKGRVYCDVGFHFGATPESIEHFNAVKDKVFGLKIYMNHTTGPLLVDRQDPLEKIFEAWEGPGPVMVHAEFGMVELALKLAKKYNRWLHVCHVPDRMSIEQIRDAKEAGQNVTCEVTAHHLVLTEQDQKSLGPYGVMRPPLKTQDDVDALWENLRYIDLVASDHAPHTRREKEDIKPPPFGVPGLETTLPVLLTCVHEGKLTIEDIERLCSTRAQELFGISIPKDTYIEIDTEKKWNIENKDLFTKCLWTPFEGKNVQGRLKKVVFSGKTVFENGLVVSEALGKVATPNF